MNDRFGHRRKLSKLSIDQYGNYRYNDSFDKHFNQVQRGIKFALVGVFVGWAVGLGVLSFVGWVVYKLLQHNGVI